MKIALFILLITFSALASSQQTMVNAGKKILKAASHGHPVTEAVNVIIMTKDAYEWVQAHQNEIGGTVYQIRERGGRAYVDLGGTLYQIKRNSDGFYETVGGTMSIIKEDSDHLKTDVRGTVHQMGINLKQGYEKAKNYGIRVFEYWLD